MFVISEYCKNACINELMHHNTPVDDIVPFWLTLVGEVTLILAYTHKLTHTQTQKMTNPENDHKSDL